MDKVIYNTAEKLVKHILWGLENMERENVNKMMIVWVKFMIFIICFGIIMDLINRFIDLILTIIIYGLILVIPVLFLWYNPVYGIPVTILFVLYLIGVVQNRKKKLTK